MIPVSITAAIADHLWQSTLFAGAAALLVLALRRNHAGIRYWLWLAASVKFLVPFLPLIALGNRLGQFARGPVATARFSIVIEEISRPFVQPPRAPAESAAAVVSHTSLLPVLLLALWACGVLAVCLSWARRWRRIHAAVRAGSPVEILAGIQVLSSPALLEPGVFGILRPVLLLPEGITGHLAPAHLEAIVAHELCHVRRRDNLAAAVHMTVEAIFWFHPLVWWLGARLVEERENACDEEVLRLGSSPEVYAESILKTCQFYLESPMVCMSGIAGADLKKRITRIMTRNASNRLTLGRKLLLAAAGISAVTGPVVFGLMNALPGNAQPQQSFTATRPAFEVASIKPNQSATGLFRISMDPSRFMADNTNLKFLLQSAYGVKEAQIIGAPAWAGSDHYNIEARGDDSAASLDRQQQSAKLRLMMQSLLADRFKLSLHHETRELPLLALVVSKTGSKMHQAAPSTGENVPLGPIKPDGPQVPHSMFMSGRGELSVMAQDLDNFADLLSHQLNTLVVNKTGLTGNYDFKLKWTPDEHQGPPMGGPADAALADAAGPSLFTALQEQLGLKLESRKGPVEVLVIDRVEKPSEN